MLLEDNVMYYGSTTSPLRLFTTSQGCDSVVHLNLTVDTTHYYIDHQLVCDSLLWIDNRWYYNDTTATVGLLESGMVIDPVDTLQTLGGCDSVANTPPTAPSRPTPPVTTSPTHGTTSL